MAKSRIGKALAAGWNAVRGRERTMSTPSTPAKSTKTQRMRAIVKTSGKQATDHTKPLAEEKSLKGRTRRTLVKRERQRRGK
jgi:hypothetical protein